MSKWCSAVIGALGLLVALSPSLARALPTYPTLVPNTPLAVDTTGLETGCITCHNNPDGGNGCPKPADNQFCWNPFGFAFNDAGKMWSPELAAGDADGDGFTNGQELQDPEGTWVTGTPRPGLSEQVTRPGDENDSPGDVDFDGDTYCFFGRDLNADGDCADPGENDNGVADRDCDDSAFFVHTGIAEDCTNAVDNDCDGLVTRDDEECAEAVDNDGDGFCEVGQDLNGDFLCLEDELGGETDCNDAAATVYPGAPVNCVDGLDNDCDELVDLDDVEDCNQDDLDGDGWCPFGQDLNGDGDCDDVDETPTCQDLNDDGDCDDPGEDAGTPLPAYDCNDTVAAGFDINPEQQEICGDGFDNDCANGSDYDDPACRHLVDADGDGVCPEGRDLDFDGNCNDVDGGEQDGCVDRVCDPAVVDCDDEDPLRAPTNDEDCVDTLRDLDCDGMPSLHISVTGPNPEDLIVEADSDRDCDVYIDFDGDGYCAAGEDGDSNEYDRDCIDGAEPVGASDCNDDPAMGGAAMSPVATESGYAECSDGLDNDCDGQVDFLDNAVEGSCEDWFDQDGDGFCPQGTDLDGDGGCTGPGEDTGPQDCKDNNGLVFPGARENCIDGIDNDCNDLADYLLTPEGELHPQADPACSREVDADGDGFCPFGVDLDGDGRCDGPGEGIGVSDCNDDPDAGGAEQHPLASEASPEECSDGLDNDCDTFLDELDRADGETDHLGEARDNCRPYLDLDGDGICPIGTDANDNGICLDTGEQDNARDCDDTDRFIRPSTIEACDDGIDNNCNGLIDRREFPQCLCEAAADCDDGDPCTMDTCARNGQCRYEAICSDAGGDGNAGVDAGAQDASVDAGSDAGSGGGAQDASVDAEGGAPEGGSEDGDAGGSSGSKGCTAAPSTPRQSPLGVLMLAALAMSVVWRRRRGGVE